MSAEWVQVDRQVIDAAKAGNKEAHMKAVSAARMIAVPFLRRFFAKVARGKFIFDEEDIANETAAQVAQELGGFKGSGDTFAAWVITIARHRLLNAIDREQAQIRGGKARRYSLEDTRGGLAGRLLAPVRTPSSQVARNELRDAVNAQVVRLPDEIRVVVELHHFRDLSLKAIAALLGKSRQWASRRARDGTEMLRKWLRRPSQYP